MTDLIELDDEQLYMAEFAINNPRSWNQSSCGVGKTLALIHAFVRARQQGEITGRMVVVCPKTSMQTAWGDDICKYNLSYKERLTYFVAYNTCRKEAFDSGADIIIVNHDGVKWMEENMPHLHQYNLQWLVIDEATAFKNPNSQRTKALQALRIIFPFRTAVSATPFAKTVLDAFMPTFIVDDGDHLGVSYYAFRNHVQDNKTIQIDADKKVKAWHDKPNAKDIVAEALIDMTVRFELEIKARNEEIYYQVDLPPKVRAAYEQMRQHGIYTEDGKVAKALNAAVKLNKMLQILTGSLYDNEGNAIFIDTERYDFVTDLIEQREDPCLVLYNWTHELEQLMAHAKKKKLKVAAINAKVTGRRRTEIIRDFQAGKLDAIIAHPKTVSHSITLTRGGAVIWASPTNSPELLNQANERVHRRGQTKDNQIIYISARYTKEEEVYRKLKDPLATQSELLALFAQSSRESIQK